MSALPTPHQRRLTSLFGLLAIVAVAGALMLNRSASADSLLLKPPTVPNPTQSAINGKAYDTLLALPNEKDKNGFLNEFDTLLLGFAGAFAILAFFGGAYTYFLSGGSEENMAKGRQQMIGSIVAFLIIVSASGIVGIFETLFATGKP